MNGNCSYGIIHFCQDFNRICLLPSSTSNMEISLAASNTNSTYFPSCVRTLSLLNSTKAFTASSPQQPMVVYGMPMYLHLPLLQHLLPQLVTPISQENKRDTLKAKIKKQLQYYFSTENLCKDTYLRSLFDKSDGKLAVKALVEFNRLKVLTHDGKYVELDHTHLSTHLHMISHTPTYTHTTISHTPH